MRDTYVQVCEVVRTCADFCACGQKNYAFRPQALDLVNIVIAVMHIQL